MSNPSYQIVAMGNLDSRFDLLKHQVIDRAGALGMDVGSIGFLDDTNFRNFDPRMPAMGIYFGAEGTSPPGFLQQLLDSSIVIAPIVTSKTRVSKEIPAELCHINVLDVPQDGANIERLSSLVFETFRLLRKERGVFISYRRKGSQPLANRLYESLDKRGFDVFIDVRSVPPAVDFQAELWHRMSDVDTIVLIDTPGFREGRWTKAELAQANLIGIQTLHLLWPGQTEDRNFAFSRFLKLELADFNGRPGRGATITAAAIKNICDLAETLRAEAMAARHAHLVDNVCDAATDLGMTPKVQPQRWIAIDISKHRSIAVVPAVGRPTSDRINAIFTSISAHKTHEEAVWVIYDSRGLHQAWVDHLKWLSTHLPVRTIPVADAAMELEELLK